MKTILRCKDYTVSNEDFDLLLDDSIDMLITSPQPSLEKLGAYYESEDYISHTDSKRTIIDKVYQLVKGISIKRKVKLLKKYTTTLNDSLQVLDIGCGTGDFLNACKKKNWTVVGVEPNEMANRISQNKLELNIYSDISEIKNQQFDCITMWHVLEHVPNLNSYIENLQKLLRPKGTLIIAVPNFKSFDANYYGKFWAAYDVPRHLWHFSQKSIQFLFAKIDMAVIRTVPMKFDSFYVSLLSEKYKTGTSNFFKAFIIGMRSNLRARRSKEYSSLIYIIKNK